MRIDVRGDLRDLERHLSETQRKVIPKAAVMALNKTMAKVKTQAVRGTAKQLKIRSKNVNQRIKFKGRLRANKFSMEAVLLVKGAMINAVDLGTVQSVRRSRHLKVGRHKFDGAFLAPMPSGKWLAVKRKGEARKPLQQVGISVLPAAGQQADKAMNTVGEQSWPVELERAIRLQLSRIK